MVVWTITVVEVLPPAPPPPPLTGGRLITVVRRRRRFLRRFFLPASASSSGTRPEMPMPARTPAKPRIKFCRLIAVARPRVNRSKVASSTSYSYVLSTSALVAHGNTLVLPYDFLGYLFSTSLKAPASKCAERTSRSLNFTQFKQLAKAPQKEFLISNLKLVFI
jgi:hypothetical protein